MKVFNIGELIRQRRIECGFSQEELCYGICEQPTMSRIENGTTTPSRSKLTALLQRLGMVGEKYYALLSENELAVANLQSEITSCIVRRDFAEGLTKLAQLEQLIEADDHILKQFILKSRVALGKEMNGQIVCYSFDERLEMLYQAIYMTVPDFTIENIDKFILGSDEIKIINQIATTYVYESRYVESIAIYSRLMNYIEAHLRTLNQETTHPPISILISYNYARVLSMNQQHKEALIFSEIGIKYSIDLRNLSYLAGLLFIKGCSLHYLNDSYNSIKSLHQCYHIYCAINDVENAQTTQLALKELFNIDIIY